MTKVSKVLLVVGDRVLIKPETENNRTESGLYLPPGMAQKAKTQRGYVIDVGPGYPIPVASDFDDEPWKERDDEVQYFPLQAQPGDLAVFIQKNAYEVIYNNEKHFVVPHNAILLLERDTDLLD